MIFVLKRSCIHGSTLNYIILVIGNWMNFSQPYKDSWSNVFGIPDISKHDECLMDRYNYLAVPKLNPSSPQVNTLYISWRAK